MARLSFTAVFAVLLALDRDFAGPKERSIPISALITIVDVLERDGSDGKVVVLGTPQDQGHRMGIFIECLPNIEDKKQAKTIFQLGFYPDIPVRLWTAAPWQRATLLGQQPARRPQYRLLCPDPDRTDGSSRSSGHAAGKCQFRQFGRDQDFGLFRP